MTTLFGNNEEAIRKLLGHRLREERLGKGWSLEVTARRMGYKRIGKGVRRILKAEETGAGGKEFLDELAGTLGLSMVAVRDEIKAQMKEQWEEWLAKWLETNPNVPVASHMVIRLLPGFYGPHALPADIHSPAQSVAYARHFVRKHGLKVCLPITPTISVWFDKDGSIEFLTDAERGQPNLPSVRLE